MQTSNATTRATTRVATNYLILGLCAVVLGAAYTVAPTPSGAESLADHIGYMLRVTARLSFGFLLLAYIARPLARLLHSGNFFMRHRRYLGLAAALGMTVHFGYVCAFLTTSGESLDLLTGVFGGAAFVLLWLMAATSSNPARRKLGAAWGRLHLLGMHYAWLIFMQTFIGAALNSGSHWAQAMSALGMVAFMLRLTAHANQRFNRTA